MTIRAFLIALSLLMPGIPVWAVEATPRFPFQAIAPVAHTHLLDFWSRQRTQSWLFEPMTAAQNPTPPTPMITIDSILPAGPVLPTDPKQPIIQIPPP